MELPEIRFIAETLTPLPGCLSHTCRPRLRTRLGETYIERTRIYRKTDRPRFVDKMPNNFQQLGLIGLILPRAKIIDARRHPMGSCFSAFKQHFAQGQDFSYDLTALGRYYRDYVALIGALRRRPAGPGPPRDLRGHGGGHRRARCAACSITTAASTSNRAAWSSTATAAPCAPSVPSRCAGRSSATGWSSGATSSPGSAP